MKYLVVLIGCVLILGCTPLARQNWQSGRSQELLRQTSENLNAPADRFYQRQRAVGDALGGFRYQQQQRQILDNQEQILRRSGDLKPSDPAYYD